MRNGYKSPHKIRELAEIAINILGRVRRLLRHAVNPLEIGYSSGVRQKSITLLHNGRSLL